MTFAAKAPEKEDGTDTLWDLLDHNDEGGLNYLGRYKLPPGITDAEEAHRRINNRFTLRSLDLKMVRAVEDLYDVLLASGVIAKSAIPASVVDLMDERKALREDRLAIAEANGIVTETALKAEK